MCSGAGHRTCTTVSGMAMLSSRVNSKRTGMPVGADVVPEGVRFRVWAPRRSRVQVICDGRSPLPLARDGEYFAVTSAAAAPGTRYSFRLDTDDRDYPDPVSRYQPEGPHGPSEVIDPSTFAWSDAAWAGITLPGQVLYELHVGTFTPEGTWVAAARELPWLKALGVTCIEMMPIAEFPGRFGWGYDGVDLFAPTRAYGHPDDLRRFVDRAHAIGLGVILDVVYNHVGPGRQLPESVLTGVLHQPVRQRVG